MPTMPPSRDSRSTWSASAPEKVAPNRPDALIRQAVFSYTTFR
ncbi:hypothetical protein C1Y40_03455 [Mycobacterium talmoniae]|uniref:Uncharacterized protein n=1 Tax=Mycobacterium talmoniae TaxID=1858794 RepID=A0A2S8BIE6_9MYCO|nr:hypothetical protein C1Y40_03455 [Mycobacterium talmoniae]